MGRYVTDPKDPDLLYIGDSMDDVRQEFPAIRRLVKWGNEALRDSGYDVPDRVAVQRGLKVYLVTGPRE